MIPAIKRNISQIGTGEYEVKQTVIEIDEDMTVKELQERIDEKGWQSFKLTKSEQLEVKND